MSKKYFWLVLCAALQACGTTPAVLELNNAGAELAVEYKGQWTAFESDQTDLTARRRDALIDANLTVANAQERSTDIIQGMDVAGYKDVVKRYTNLAKILDARIKANTDIAALPATLNKTFAANLADIGSPAAKAGDIGKGLLRLNKNEFDHTHFDNFIAFAKDVGGEVQAMKKAADDAAKKAKDAADKAAAAAKTAAPAP